MFIFLLGVQFIAMEGYTAATGKKQVDFSKIVAKVQDA